VFGSRDTISLEELGDILAPLGILLQDPQDDDRAWYELPAMGWRVGVQLYGREGEYSGIELQAAWSFRPSAGLDETLYRFTLINRWNRTRRKGRAHLDEDGDPCLEEELDLDGGVSDDAIREWVRSFHLAMAAFGGEVLPSFDGGVGQRDEDE
jgi:hypothetical protein